jgi:exopolyphosphatase/guanosine-5'-triphosphate,3'-diphosphate pyrophosphatase
VLALMQRYGIDVVQAGRVEHTALQLFDRVAQAWHLQLEDRLLLAWAARLHELGLAIAHSQYQVHSAYILEHSDIAGFSQQEQRLLAALVRTHRRRVPKSAFDALPERLLVPARRTAALLRLAVVLHRSHDAEALPDLRLHADGNALILELPPGWVDERPLLASDLATEVVESAGLGIAFSVK